MKRRFKIDKSQLSFSLRKKVPWTNRPIILGLAFLFLLFFGRAAFRVYESDHESAQAAAEAEAQLKELQNRKDFLDDSLERLSTSEGRETELRKRFGVALPGENVAIIVDGDSTSTSTSTSSFWTSIKNFFQKK